MEPDDLSFIDISGEDDSLLPLQHIANDDVSSLDKAYFPCSLLQSPRSASSIDPPLVSPIAGITGNEDVGKLDLLSNTGSVNKENLSSNKPEVPKLNMEPLQMKRKKKGGGFNLRKSLAWNKAFFTEEGVLDPLELSMISGNSGKSSGEMLSVIEEDERESLAGNSKNVTAPEENLLKELPVKNLREDRNNSGALFPKNGSPARVKVASASAGKRKALSTQDANRYGSKHSGCPRPVASSSPANANTTKSTKELKVSRVPARKLDISVHSATAKNNIPVASNTKRNQISQPAASVQRNVGSKVASNSTKSARGDARSDSTGRSITVKSSIQQARRNVTNSAMENHSSAKSQHPFVCKTKNSLTINTAPPLPTCVNVSNNHGGDTRKVLISLPSDGSMQSAQIQTAKPSGLRMPSPSLGFFNQSKASASHSLLPRSNQASNVPESNIPNLRKFGALNATQERPPARGKMPDMANGVTATGTRIPKSIKGSSIPTSLSTDSHEEVKSNLHIHEIQKVELDVPANSNSYGTVNNQQKFHSQCNNIDQESMPKARPSEIGKISHVVNDESKSEDNKLLLHRSLSDQLKNDDDDKRVANIYPMSMDLSETELETPHLSSCLEPKVQVEGVFETQNMIDNQIVEAKVCNSLIKNDATSSELQSGDDTSDSINDILKRQDDCLGFVHHVNEQSRKQDVEMMTCIDKVSTEGQNPCMNNGALSKEIRSSEFHTCKTADGSPEVRLCSGVAESSHGQPHSLDKVEAKDCVAGIDNICTESQVGNVEVLSVDGILSSGSDKVVLCSSASDEVVVDNMSKIVSDANGSELTSSNALCTIPPAVQDYGFHISEIPECRHGHDTHEIKLHGLITSGDSEMVGKDQSINAAKTTIDEVSIVCPNSGDFSRCELDLQHFQTQPSAPVETENCVRVNDVIAAIKVKSGYVVDAKEQKGVENKLNNHCSNSDLRPADDISYCQHGISMASSDPFSEMHMVCPQSVVGDQNRKASDKLLSEDDSSICQHSTSTVHNDQLSSMHMFCQQSVEGIQNPFSEMHMVCPQFMVGDQNPKASDKLLSEDDSSNCQHSTSTMHNDQLSSMHMFCQQSIEGIQIPKASDEILSENSMPFEKSGESYTGKVTDISLDVKSINGRVPESPQNLLQHQQAEQGNEEITCFNYTIRKSLVEDAQMQVLERSLLADSCKSKFNAAVVDEIHNSDLVAAQGSLDAHGLCLNDKLIVNNSAFEKYPDNDVCGNLMNDVLEQSDAFANESNSSIVCTQVAAAVMEGGIDEDQKAEEDADVQNIGVNVLKSDVLPEKASISQNNGLSNCEINQELENVDSATEDATMSSSGGVFQDIEVNILMSDPNCEMQYELEDEICHTEDQDVTECLKKSRNDKKQHNLVIKPPPHAVPFSDEWLAAFEAAGEEILTMKSGAVQHSPLDKPFLEPSPWSPVKRKNNQGLGPFDCTKFTNGNINTPPSNSTQGD